MIKRMRLLLLCLIVLTVPSFAFASKTHKVKKNESLYSIAKRYHVRVGELKAANNLVNGHIRTGDLLVIPHGSEAASAASRMPAERSGASSYRVKRGDNLTRVSKKTGLSVKELKRINGLATSRLKPGQLLALRHGGLVDEEKSKSESRLTLRNGDLFSEKDYEQSLAELTEADSNREVDLSKNLELKSDNVKMLKAKAYGFLGTHYRFGGNSLRGIDCSAFVQQVFREMEVSLPRTAREQYEVGCEVAPGDLQKGDLVFFRTYASYPSHVGIYLGEHRMIHASSKSRRVVISSMDTPYYRSRFIGAKRISKINPDIFRFDDLLTDVDEETSADAPTDDTLDVGLN